MPVGSVKVISLCGDWRRISILSLEREDRGGPHSEGPWSLERVLNELRLEAPQRLNFGARNWRV